MVTKDADRDDKGEAHRSEGRRADGAVLALAAQLSALETRIGIKTGQLDAWRDYTTALQSLAAPILREKTDDERGVPQAGSAEQKDPFDRDQKLADELIARAANAEKLKAAIASLRGALTPLQLEQLALATRMDRLQGPGFAKAVAGRGDRPDYHGASPLEKPWCR